MRGKKISQAMAFIVLSAPLLPFSCLRGIRWRLCWQPSPLYIASYRRIKANP